MKLTNLGSLIRRIEQSTPHLLQQTFPSAIVHPNITFQLFPETHMFKVHGSTAYTTVQKMIQLAVSPLLVPSGSQLDILNMRITKEECLEDRRLFLHWRTFSPTSTGSAAPPRAPSFEPGRLIASLGLMPEEYPVLAGSFEFGFDTECNRILVHILRNVEYMARPDSQLICT